MSTKYFSKLNNNSNNNIDVIVITIVIGVLGTILQEFEEGPQDLK